MALTESEKTELKNDNPERYQARARALMNLWRSAPLTISKVSPPFAAVSW